MRACLQQVYRCKAARRPRALADRSRAPHQTTTTTTTGALCPARVHSSIKLAGGKLLFARREKLFGARAQVLSGCCCRWLLLRRCCATTTTTTTKLSKTQLSAPCQNSRSLEFARERSETRASERESGAPISSSTASCRCFVSRPRASNSFLFRDGQIQGARLARRALAKLFASGGSWAAAARMPLTAKGRKKFVLRRHKKGLGGGVKIAVEKIRARPSSARVLQLSEGGRAT